MSDRRSVIDQELKRVELRPFTIQAFHRRREQKRRRQRIVAGVVGVAVGLLAVLIGTSTLRSNEHPATPPVPPGSHESEVTWMTGAGIVGVVPETGARRTIVPADLLSVSAFAWSPDGAEVVFERKDASGCRVIVLTVATGHERVLARCTPSTSGTSVDWSADGNWIAFSTQSNGGPGSSVLTATLIHPDGTGKRLLTDPDGYPIAVGFFSLSRDGSQIAYSSGPRIYAMDVDGSDRRFLARGWSPDWSPDGPKIGFWRAPRGPNASGDPFIWQIWSVDADGTHLTKIHAWKHCCLGAGPAWSPDGAYVAVIVLSRLHVISIDGSDERILGKVVSPSVPVWRSVP